MGGGLMFQYTRGQLLSTIMPMIARSTNTRSIVKHRTNRKVLRFEVSTSCSRISISDLVFLSFLLSCFQRCSQHMFAKKKVVQCVLFAFLVDPVLALFRPLPKPLIKIRRTQAGPAQLGGLRRKKRATKPLP